MEQVLANFVPLLSALWWPVVRASVLLALVYLRRLYRELFARA